MNHLVSWDVAMVRIVRAQAFVNLGEPNIPVAWKLKCFRKTCESVEKGTSNQKYMHEDPLFPVWIILKIVEIIL